MHPSVDSCERRLRGGVLALVLVVLASCDGYLTELPTTEVPPAITGFALSPSEVDLTFAPGSVTAQVQIRDAVSIDSLRVRLGGPDGTVLPCLSSAPSEGNRTSGSWSCSWDLAPGVRPGHWTVESVSAFEGPTPAIEVSGSDLGEAGFPTVVMLTAVDRILVDPPVLALEFPSDTAVLTALVLNNLDEQLDDAPVEWSSADPLVATVDASGKVTPAGRGTTTVHAALGEVVGSASLEVIVPIGSILVTPEESTIALVGGEQQFTALPVGLDGLPLSAVQVTWSSTDELVASVDEHGLALATGEGTTTIRAHAGEVVGHAQLSVVAQPPELERIEVVPSAAVLTSEGETLQLIARGVDTEGAVVEGLEFEWESTATDVATVDAAGMVTAIGPGTAQVHARTPEAPALGGTSFITVLIGEEPQVARVAIEPDTLELTDVGQTGLFVATALDEDGIPIEGLEVAWSSSAPLIATVSSTGVVTAIAEGEAVVTATIEGITGSAVVIVDPEQPEPALVVVEPESAELERLSEVAFTATVFDQFGDEIPDAEIIWSSSNTCRASVEASGIVTGWIGGSATIRATAGTTQGTASVEIAPAPEGVPTTLAGEWRICGAITSQVIGVADLTHIAGETEVSGTVTRASGATYTLGATSNWSDDRLTLRWTQPVSGGERSVAIDGATALNRELLTGPLVDQAELGSEEVYLSRISEGPPPLARIEVTPDTLELTGAGATGQLVATVFDSADLPVEGVDVTWSSSNPSVATVNADGLVTSLAEGQVTVTATAAGIVGSAVVMVVQEPPVPATVTVSPSSADLERDETLEFSAEVRDQFGEIMPGIEVEWTSTNACVIDVDADGTALSFGGGGATIRAAVGDLFGAATVNVEPGPAGPPSTVAGIWRVCGFDTGEHLMDLELQHEAGEAGVSGTMTSIEYPGTTATLNTTSRWMNDALTVDWNVVVAGGTRTSLIAGATAHDIDRLQGDYTDRIASTNQLVWLVRTPPSGTAPPLDRIDVTPDSIQLPGPGATAQLTATGFDANDVPMDGLEFAWASSNPSIVVVDGDGLVTAVAPGLASVTAGAQGVTGSALVIVSSAPPEPTSIVIEPAVAEVSRLSETQFSARVLDQFGTEIPGIEIEWSSSSPCIGSVDDAGLAFAWSGGNVSIMATAGSLEASASLVIEQAPEGVPATVQGRWRKCRASDGRHLGDFDLNHTAGETQVTGTYTEPPPFDDNVYTLSQQSEWVDDQLTIIWFQRFQGSDRRMWLQQAQPLNQEVIFGPFLSQISGQVHDVYLTRY